MGKGGDRVDSVFKKPVKAPKTLEKILVGVLSATPVSTGSNPVCASTKNQRNLVLFSFVHSIFLIYQAW